MPKKVYSFRLTPWVAQAAEEQAARAGKTLTQLVEECLLVVGRGDMPPEVTVPPDTVGKVVQRLDSLVAAATRTREEVLKLVKDGAE